MASSTFAAHGCYRVCCSALKAPQRSVVGSHSREEVGKILVFVDVTSFRSQPSFVNAATEQEHTTRPKPPKNAMVRWTFRGHLGWQVRRSRRTAATEFAAARSRRHSDQSLALTAARKSARSWCSWTSHLSDLNPVL